jgi:hypothetical protein
VVGFLTVIFSVIIMINKKLHFSNNKVIYYLTPIIAYFVLVPFAYYFINATLNKLQLLILLSLIALFYTLVTHLAVLIYTHWIKSKDKAGSVQVAETLKSKTQGILGTIFKVVTLSSLMITLPLIWFGLVIYFNSELRIDYEAYRYEHNPTSENLTELTIDLINYRGYEERIKYLPLVMEDETVLKNLYDRREETSRAELYALMGETNLSSIIVPEDSKALVMSQYINAFLMLGKNEAYLDLMTTRSEQFGERNFYYFFESNVIMFNREYKPVYPEMLSLLEQVYDQVDANDKTLIYHRMINIRVRQTIYFLLGDEESDAALEVLFKQLMEELKIIKENEKNQ